MKLPIITGKTFARISLNRFVRRPLLSVLCQAFAAPIRFARAGLVERPAFEQKSSVVRQSSRHVKRNQAALLATLFSALGYSLKLVKVGLEQ